MKVKKTLFKMETACQPVLSESLVEGRLSLPADRPDIERVLFIQGRIHVNAEPAEGKVFMDGNVSFSVVYLDLEGGIEAFDASSPFRHTQDMEEAEPGMHIIARGSVREITYSVEEGRAVNVRGIVGVEIKGSVVKNCEAAASVELPELQTRMVKQRLMTTREQRRETAYIREDLRVSQTMPTADKILFADAYAVVSSVRNEDLKIIVEGNIKLTVLYLSADKSAPLQQLSETVPFGQIIASEAISAGDAVTAEAAIAEVNVSVADEASDVLRLSARMTIVCAVRGEQEVEFLEDAYSLSNRLTLDHEEQVCRYPVLSGNARTIARSTISVPASQPSVSRVICLKGVPSIASALPGIDRVYLEGLMMYTVCYYSPEGMWSYTGETPFESQVLLDGITPEHDVEVRTEVENCMFEGTGRDISVKFMMDVHVQAFTQCRIHMVSGLDETDEPAATRQGITIYFADGGETAWDIAKRFATTLESVKAFNPDIGDIAGQGQKILIMS